MTSSIFNFFAVWVLANGLTLVHRQLLHWILGFWIRCFLILWATMATLTVALMLMGGKQNMLWIMQENRLLILSRYY